MALVLYSRENSAQGYKSLIAAAYAGTKVEVKTPEQAPATLKQHVLSGVSAFDYEWPVLQFTAPNGSEEFLWGSNAIVRHVARSSTQGQKLFGSSTIDQGHVEQWISFSQYELDLPASAWLYPIFGYIPNDAETTNNAKKHIIQSLEALNNHLLSNTFLVGERVSLADIVVSTSLLDLYKTVLDTGFRKRFVNLNRWFSTLIHQSEFVSVLGSVTLCEKMQVAKPPQKEQPKQEEQKKETPKEQKKQEQKKEAPKEKKQPQKQEGGGGKKQGREDRRNKRQERGQPQQVQQELNEFFGVLPLNQSQERLGRKYVSISELDSYAQQSVWLIARVFTTRGKGNVCFLLLRQRIHTVQAVVSKSDNVSKDMVKFAQKLSKESFVLIEGLVTVPSSKIESATQHSVEIQVQRLFTISSAEPLPLLIEDAARPKALLDKQEEEIKAIDEQIQQLTQSNASDSASQIQELTKKKEAAKKYVDVGQDTRLDNRILDLRTPANQAIFKLQSAVQMLFRRFLTERDFVEIHTPKILGAASESGASVFQLKYFDKIAYLAQSPQFYKQMAVVGDLERVFEIGPVFRAEESYTHRHMTEFMGLDLEMAIYEHYHEALEVLGDLFIYIFDSFKNEFAKELEIISQQYPFEPVEYIKPTLMLKYPEAVSLLKEAGVQQDDFDDLSTANEKALGKIVKEKYKTDFFILEKFPMSVRPFYTMPDPVDPRYSNGYDFFLRGEEILSGAQRVHDPALLTKQAEEKGVPLHTVQYYIDSFKYGAYPHAGAGIGLERVIMLYLGLPNIRKTSLFPRDPSRLTP